LELESQAPVADEIRFLHVVEGLKLPIHGLFSNLEDLAEISSAARPNTRLLMFFIAETLS